MAGVVAGVVRVPSVFASPLAWEMVVVIQAGWSPLETVAVVAVAAVTIVLAQPPTNIIKDIAMPY